MKGIFLIMNTMAKVHFFMKVEKNSMKDILRTGKKKEKERNIMKVGK